MPTSVDCSEKQAHSIDSVTRNMNLLAFLVFACFRDPLTFASCIGSDTTRIIYFIFLNPPVMVMSKKGF